MPTSNQTQVINKLIGRLPERESRSFLLKCDTVDLQFGEVLRKPGEKIQYVYFPVTGFISLLGKVENHPALEISLIGNEGMLGLTLMLGVNDSPLLAVVQGSGSALRMSKVSFHELLAKSRELRKILNRYLYITLVQFAQTAVCTHFHEVDKRLARWLLMTHDRAHADNFYLTHQVMADMLGVRRSAVTIAAGILQQQVLISYTRGNIRINNRKGLEAISCECYSIALDDYKRILS